MDAFNFWSMFIQVINLGIVLFVLKKFLFDPYLKLVEKTEHDQKEIAHVHEAVKKIKKDADDEATALLSEAHKEVSKMRKSAEDNAQKHVEKIIHHAEEQAKIIEETAKAEIQVNEQAFMKRMKDGVMVAAVELNKKLLGQSNTARMDFMKAHLEDALSEHKA